MKVNSEATINLLMFSGGLDSTYVLHGLLSKKEHVWVHHIRIRNRVENRSREERAAVDKILKYMKSKFGSVFGYSESVWDFPFLGYFGWDMDLVVFTAAQVAPNIRDGGKIRLVTGRCRDDDERRVSLQHTDKVQKLWEAAIIGQTERVETDIYRPIRHLSKRELVAGLPEELISLVWFCRRPVAGEPCGVCHSCKSMRPILEREQ